jgi:hypothetical protein
MIKKNDLLKECLEVMKRLDIVAWYDKNLKDKPQYYTIATLNAGVVSGALTVKEALALALVIGIQWNTHFEDEVMT